MVQHYEAYRQEPDAVEHFYAFLFHSKKVKSIFPDAERLDNTRFWKHNIIFKRPPKYLNMFYWNFSWFFVINK